MTRPARLVPLSLSLGLALAGPPRGVGAADLPLPGLKLVMKDVNGRQRAVLVVKSAAVAVPAPGSADDPTIVGASLEIANPVTGESASLSLPASGWTASASGGVFRFVNKAAPAGPSPVKVALAKQGRVLKVSARATGITLDESSQGALSATLTLGDTHYCAHFGGVLRDEPGRFTARNASAPASCPGGAPTSSTSSSTTTTPTTTSTSSTEFVEETTTTFTTTTQPAGCAPPAVSLGAIRFTITPGSSDCGGVTLTPNPAPPHSGRIESASGAALRDLGVGCLYVGADLNGSLPGAALPDGSVALLDIAAADGLALTLAASNGTGPLDCTRGAGPASHCATGTPGTDGFGLCTSDADCGNGSSICVPDANCHFGPPTPISAPVSPLSTCVVNVIATDACGTADLVSGDSTLSVALYSRLYLTGDQTSPCPRCVGGVCSAGKRAGEACTPVGSFATSLDCPPDDFDYLGQLPVNLTPITTAESVTSAPSGFFCPGQLQRGAFGRIEARTIRQTGVGLTDLGGGTLFSVRLAGSFCVPATGSALVNNVVDLPGPGTVSVAGTIGVCLLSGTCGTLCNPCPLGPLCDLLCAPCVLCP